MLKVLRSVAEKKPLKHNRGSISFDGQIYFYCLADFPVTLGALLSPHQLPATHVVQALESAHTDTQHKQTPTPDLSTDLMMRYFGDKTDVIKYF